MIRLIDVTKTYRSNQVRKTVLDNVSAVFDTRHAYGILGLNGAGKSTLLRLVAGTEMPNRGRIYRGASISWPLAFGGGFHPGMTGRENLNFVANIYGVSGRYVTGFVADFAELGAYIDAPVQSYSAGMQARLAFAMSMAIEFDFYLIDEVTAVGDERFAARCTQALLERRSRSGLMIVSHGIGAIKALCDRAAILKDGKLILFDDVDTAIEVYRKTY
ncbi:Polysialic acid transport ATP-binding protein KpsT [Alphaproteobacteria bacterium SO-S41]|nr:Polysialic acid transport ATP-binding protein KpsT [Alphaproteobacteria bacterium SO-S41]